MKLRKLFLTIFCVLALATSAFGAATDYWVDNDGKIHGYDHITKDGPVVDARAYATLADAITAIGANRKTVLIASSQAVTADLTIPGNVTLSFTNGGMVNVSATKTLTINGPIVAPLDQIFTGDGTISLSGTSKQRIVYPEWWGIDGTNDHIEIQKAIDCAETAYNSTYGTAGTVHLSAKPYILGNTTLLIDTDGVTFEGEGWSTVLCRGGGGTHWTLNVKAVNLTNQRIAYITVRNLQFFAHTSAPTGGGHMNIENGSTFNVENIHFIDGKINLQISGCWNGRFSKIKSTHTSLWGAETANTMGVYIIKGSYVANTVTAEIWFNQVDVQSDHTTRYGHMGFVVKSSDGLWVNDMHTLGFYGSGLYIDPSADNWISSLKFQNCFFDNCGKSDHTGYPVYIAGSTTGCIVDINFYNCTMYGAYDSAGVGADVFKSSATGVDNLTISNCQISGGYYHGINIATLIDGITITGCQIYNNNAANGAYYGAYIQDGTKIAITGNIFGMDADDPDQALGLKVASITDGVISGNLARGNTNSAEIAGDNAFYLRIEANQFRQTMTATGDAQTHSTVYLNDAVGGKTVNLTDGWGVGNIVTIININTANWTLDIDNHETSSPEIGTVSQNDCITLMWTGGVWVTMHNYGVVF